MGRPHKALRAITRPYVLRHIETKSSILHLNVLGKERTQGIGVIPLFQYQRIAIDLNSTFLGLQEVCDGGLQRGTVGSHAWFWLLYGVALVATATSIAVVQVAF